MSEHLRSSIILASAGTGKTFQLTRRYVGLLGLGVDPSRILATTFTRQAAGQIFDRVVARLLESPDVRPLSVMLHALDRLGISTLDSLFAKLASAYAAELGLPPGWRIVEDDEDQRLRSHAVEVALEDSDRDDVLTLLRLMMAKRFSSAVASGLLSKVKDAHGVFQSAPPAAWSVIDVPGDLHEMAEEELAAHLAAWFDVPLYRGKTGTKVDGVWEKAHAKAHEKGKQGEWEAFADSGLAAKILAGEQTFNRGPIEEAVVRAYRPLLDHARWTLLTRHVEGTAALRDLLDRFDRAYATLKRKRRAYRFDDVPRALRAIHRDITLDEIAFRLDATIDHVLLDEFQDTSASQFVLLEPLLTEILAGGGGSREDASSRSVFCVGDIKQSLYQWRDAEPGLFAALPGRWPQLEESELHVSHRSSPVILEVVNKVFGSIASNPVLAEHPGVVASWAKGFERHEATIRLKSAPGFARLGVAPRADNGEPQVVHTLRAAAERVAAMVATFPGRSVGILVRAKKGIPRIIFELKRLGVDASEEGGNPLTDAPAVAAALSALHLGDHPGDTAAAFHVATSPLANLLGLHEWSNTPARLAAAARVRSRAVHGLAPLLSGWLDEIASLCDARDVRRFEQLITLAQEFDARNDPRAENFVTMARSKHVDDPTAHLVRVLTIHASKGLEFDAVVLPDLEARIASKAPGLLYRRNDPFGEIDAVTRYPSEVLRALDPRLEALHAHHRSKALSEELCVLYVALTRARYSLDILIAPAKPDAKSVPFSLGGILLEALAPGVRAESGELFSLGDPMWAAGLHQQPAPPPRPPITITLERGESPARLGRETPPSHTAHGASRNARAADRGTLLHAWAEQIEWLDDEAMLRFESRSQDLLRLARSLRLDDSLDLPAELAAFRAMIGQQEIRDVLSRERYLRVHSGHALTLYREVPFSFVRLGAARASPKVIAGRIDRLVVTRNPDGVPVAAEVVDFKSDKVTGPEQVATAADGYRPQMALYSIAATRLTGLAPDRVVCSVVFLSAGKALNLSPQQHPLPDKSILFP